jgi:hypothetical protein
MLAITTWVSTSFIFATRPEVYSSGTLNTLVRLPASLPKQLPSQLPGVFVAPRINEPIEMNVVRVPCWDQANPDVSPISARWIRLTGTFCKNKVGSGIMSVRNLTTGYAATVFPLQGKNLTTDFIPLKAGKNEILIRLEPSKGVAFESRLAFQRD